MMVLVTGGAGFIGSHVVRELARRGHQVTSFDMKKPTDTIPNVNYFEGYLRSEECLRVAMRSCDTVIHLAAMLGVKNCTENPMAVLETNIIGTRNVMHACIDRGITHLMFSSSSEVYGSQDHPMNEDARLQPQSEYAISKLAAEEYVRAFGRLPNRFGTVFRLFSIYGPGQSDSFVMTKFANAVTNNVPIQIYGDGSQKRSLCHVRDAARAIVNLAEIRTAWNQAYNIGNPDQPISIGSLAALFYGIANKPYAVEYVPFDSEESDRSEYREIKFRHPDIFRLGLETSFRPSIRLEEGIRDLLAHASRAQATNQ